MYTNQVLHKGLCPIPGVFNSLVDGMVVALQQSSFARARAVPSGPDTGALIRRSTFKGRCI